MKTYTSQYVSVFWLSWVAMYVIFPSWIGLHSRFPDINDQVARTFIVTFLLTYLSLAAYIINHFFCKLNLDKPIIIRINGLAEIIKNHIWIVFMCCLSAVLHLNDFTLVPVVGEESFLTHTLFMYDAISSFWKYTFNFPLQYFLWFVMAVSSIIIFQRKTVCPTVTSLCKKASGYLDNNFVKITGVILMFVILNIYAYIFPYYSYNESVPLIRYPPVSRYLYVFLFSAFEPSLTGPRALQLILYIIGALYLYRTILLFGKKETAFLGASIYLFSPIIFHRAASAAAEPGAITFIIIISFYFLRFVRDEDGRDLVLSSYFTGMGFLYKRGILIMFFICFTFLFLRRLKKHNFRPWVHLIILIMSLFPILPYIKIGTGNPIILSNLINLNELLRYTLMLQSQISTIILILLFISFPVLLLFKKNTLSFFFGLLLFEYYVLFTIMYYGQFNHRYAMSLYPAIAVLLAQFLTIIAQNIKWKHSLKALSAVIIVYLAFLCVVPRSSLGLITYKYKDFEIQHYPWDKTAEWIKKIPGKNARLLGIYFTPDAKLYLRRFYPDRKDIDLRRIHYLGQGEEEFFYPFNNLKKYCDAENISFIMMRYGPNNSFTYSSDFILRVETMRYLKESLDIDNEFTEVAEFNIDDNHIIIYRRVITDLSLRE